MLAEDVGGIVLPMLFCAPDAKRWSRTGTEYYGMDFWFEKDGQLYGLAYPAASPAAFTIREEDSVRAGGVFHC